MSSQLPKFLQEMLINQYGEELTLKIVNGYSKKRYTTFRVNTLKSNNDEIENCLKQKDIEYEKVVWYENAFILKNADENTIRNLSIYEEGKIYLQSLSSMLPPILLKANKGEDILDMAAAPGGKTTEIATLTDNKANITACEKNKIRYERLKYNIEKQGANVYCMLQDARNLSNFFSFDKILLDAPCSGSGTLKIEDDLEKKFTPKLIEQSIKLQTTLLKKAIDILKKGKEMIYSTCSILSVENEDIIEKLLKDKKIEIVPIEEKIANNIPLLPSKIKGTIVVCPNEFYEGFFVAKIKKI